MQVELLEPHVIAGRWWPAEAQLTLPPGVSVTPRMLPLDDEARAALDAMNVQVFGRWVFENNAWRLVDDPPIPRPIWDPQPTPAVGGGGPPR